MMRKWAILTTKILLWGGGAVLLFYIAIEALGAYLMKTVMM